MERHRHPAVSEVKGRWTIGTSIACLETKLGMHLGSIVPDPAVMSTTTAPSTRTKTTGGSTQSSRLEVRYPPVHGVAADVLLEGVMETTAVTGRCLQDLDLIIATVLITLNDLLLPPPTLVPFGTDGIPPELTGGEWSISTTGDEDPVVVALIDRLYGLCW